MYRLIIIYVSVLIGCQGAKTDKMECRALLNPAIIECCKGDWLKFIDVLKKDKDEKECFKPFTESSLCDIRICVAEKKGYLNENRTINKEALKDSIQKDFADNPTFVSKITEKCVEGDLDDYGKPGVCDLNKLLHCIVIEGISSCPEWHEEYVGCSGVENLVEKCQA